jgi:hypothetical protein
LNEQPLFAVVVESAVEHHGGRALPLAADREPISPHVDPSYDKLRPVVTWKTLEPAARTREAVAAVLPIKLRLARPTGTQACALAGDDSRDRA